jgi:oligopeptide transport system ATP-binding protein
MTKPRPAVAVAEPSASPDAGKWPLLSVSGLVVTCKSPRGATFPVRGVSWELRAGERLGIIGESGSGKTVSCLAIMGLLPAEMRITGGAISYQGVDLLQLDERAMRRVRGSDVAMVFQGASASLNPVFRVGRQIADVLKVKRNLTAKQAAEEAVRILAGVGISNPAQRFHDFPHQFSGGQAQRIMIGMMLALSPKVLLADEPTTGLDPIVADRIVDLLSERCQEQGASLVFVSHDMGPINRTCDRIIVMYAGEIMESGTTKGVLGNPAHPYTEALVNSSRLIKRPGVADQVEYLSGLAPSLEASASRCAFSGRCPLEASLDNPSICRERRPHLGPRVGGGTVACHFKGDRDA